MQILILVHWGIPLLCIQSCLHMWLITWTTNKTGLNLAYICDGAGSEGMERHPPYLIE